MIKHCLRILGSTFFLCSLFAWNTWAQTPTNSLPLNYLQPDSYRIAAIQVVGNKHLDTEALLAMLEIQVGDQIQIPGPTIEQVIKKLWQQKLIKDVHVYVSKVIGQSIELTIAITESPRLSQYCFEGISNKEIETCQQKINLESGIVITDQLLKSLKKTLQDQLVHQGYLNAKVDITSLPDPDLPDYRQIKVKVIKGETFIINKILLKGNAQIHAEILKAQFRHIKEKPRFTLVKDILQKTFSLQPFKKGGILWQQPNLEKTLVYLQSHVIPFASKFVHAHYEADKNQLINYYQTQGYKDATIVADSVYKQGKGLLNVELQINEGKQYYLGQVKWVGNYRYDTNTLNQIFDIPTGAIYNPALIQQRLFSNPMGQDIASLYMDNGYLFFNVEPVEVNITNNRVDLEMRIQEGVQASINRVHITGNHLTHDPVIRRELKTLPGDTFNRAKLIRSQRELAMLNIFDPAINIIPRPNLGDTTVDLTYVLKELPKFDIKAGGGWAGKADFNFSLTLGGNNFSLGNLLQGKLPIGDAQTLNLKADFNGKNHQNFILQFMEPWLGGKKPTAFNFAINKSFQQYEKNGKLGSFGINSNLGTRLHWPDDYFIVRCGVAYHLHQYKNYALWNDTDKHSGTMHELNFNTTIERNSINDPIYPTQGSEFSLHVKLTPPYSLFSKQGHGNLPIQKQYTWKEYQQWILDGSYFQKLLGDCVLNIRSHGGILGGYSSKQGIGPFERFSMGGSGLVDFSLLNREIITLRGYPEAYILPKDNKSGYQGGTIFDKFVLEVRYPLVKSSVGYIYALAFAEAGNTWLHDQDWQPWDLKTSTGLGLRMHSPWGIIGFDWGYGFDRPDIDKIEFHWSLGSKIR